MGASAPIYNMLKIFDCSNSTCRPLHRGFGGPIENTIVRDLKKYASDYGCEFVLSLRDADVAFTNDVFTDSVVASNIPKIKRMDGVFFQDDLKNRNVSLNLAATQADMVIFISEFSRHAFNALYGIKLHASTVVLNWVDQDIFDFRHRTAVVPNKFVAVATSWDRPEKRYNDIIKLANRFPNKQFFTVGHVNDTTQYPNVKHYGYIEDEHTLASILHEMDAMICLAYRDAAPKTVAQGISTGLPCFGVRCGGVPELIGDTGLLFGEYTHYDFMKTIPPVSDHMCPMFEIFCRRYGDYARTLRVDPHRYQKVLASYFNIFKLVDQAAHTQQ